MRWYCEDETSLWDMWETSSPQSQVSKLQEEETMRRRHGQQWNVDPYDLRYDEAAGMYTEEELQVVTVDYSKRRR
jgi:hypothetical protein